MDFSKAIFSCDSSSICHHVGRSVCRSVCPSVGQQRVSRSVLKQYKVSTSYVKFSFVLYDPISVFFIAIVLHMRL